MKKYILPVAIIFIMCLLLGIGFSVMSFMLSDAQQASIKAQQGLLLENLRTPVHNALQGARLGAECLATSRLSQRVLEDFPFPDDAADTPAGQSALPPLTDPDLRLNIQRMAALFPYVEFFAILDNQKRVRLTSHPMAPGTSVVQDHYANQSLKGLREFSPPYLSPISKTMVIAATSPIARGEKVIGVAVAVINMQKLANATTNRFDLGTTGYLSLADNKGNLIIHPDTSQVGRNIAALPTGQQIMAQDSGYVYGVIFEEPKWIVFTTLPRTGWKLMLSIAYSEYMRPTTTLRNTTIMAGVGMTLLVTLAVAWLSVLFIRRMEKARVAADDAIRAKNDFLANMSHEIRTPMNGIIGLAHLMGKTSLTSKQADYLAKIQFSSNSLLHLIGDILDISKIEAQKLSIEYVYFRLSDVLHHVQSTLHAQATHKGLFLELHISENVPPVIRSDPFRLGQVLLNFVGNGLKFTQHGGVRIAVDASPTSCSDSHDAFPPEGKGEGVCTLISFTIRDTGIGMRPEEMQRLFQPFAQADSSTTRKFGGTGLGLVICKHLAHMLGGEVHMTSTYGEGSTFSFSITCLGYSSEEGLTSSLLSDNLFAASPPAQTLVDYESYPNTVLPEESATGRDSALCAESDTLCQVLLVEDNEINQQVAAEMLLSMGFVVTLADNGRAAVELTKTHCFDIIFMDIQMPEMDGLTATSIIRAQGITTPIVAMTAHAMPGDHAKSLSAGMNSHITKPISYTILEATLRTYCPQMFSGGQDA